MRSVFAFFVLICAILFLGCAPTQAPVDVAPGPVVNEESDLPGFDDVPEEAPSPESVPNEPGPGLSLDEEDKATEDKDGDDPFAKPAQ